MSFEERELAEEGAFLFGCIWVNLWVTVRCIEMEILFFDREGRLAEVYPRGKD